MAVISFVTGVILTGIFTYELGKYVIEDIKNTPAEREKMEEIQDWTELKSKIRELNHTLDKIEEVEHMMTDMEICKPGEKYTNFSISWDNRKYDFMSDGKATTSDKLRELAEAEYQKLRSTLLEQIQNLQ